MKNERNSQAQESRIAALQGALENKTRLTALWRCAAVGVAVLVLLLLVAPLPEPGITVNNVHWIVWLEDTIGLPPDRTVEIRTVLGAGLITLLVFTIGFQFFERRDKTGEQSRATFYAIVDNEKIVDELDNRSKRALVTKSLSSLLSKEIGKAVSEGVVLPLIEDYTPYRRQYQYRVWALSSGECPSSGDLVCGEMFPIDKYRWMRERIQYQRYFPEEDQIYNGSYQIYLAFNKGALDTLFRRQRVFFRAMIELDSGDIAALLTLAENEENLRKFVLGDLQFEARDGGLSGDIVNADGIAISIEYVPAKVHDEPAQRVIAITVPQSKQERSEKRFPGISLRYPYLRTATHFTFTLPQPCENPTFEFFPSEDMEQVEGIYYLSMISDERITIHRPKEKGVLKSERIELTGWVFPTSGVTYTWSNNR